MSNFVKLEIKNRGEPWPTVYLEPPTGMLFIRAKALMDPECIPQTDHHALLWCHEACRVLRACTVSVENADVSNDYLLDGLLTADEVAHVLARMVADGEVGEELQQQLVAAQAEMN